jgi:hypothetical protein
VSPVSAPSYLVFKGFVDYLTANVVDPNSLNPDPIPDTDPDSIPFFLSFILQPQRPKHDIHHVFYNFRFRSQTFDEQKLKK